MISLAQKMEKKLPIMVNLSFKILKKALDEKENPSNEPGSAKMKMEKVLPDISTQKVIKNVSLLTDKDKPKSV
jgi:hypothetical protein